MAVVVDFYSHLGHPTMGYTIWYRAMLAYNITEQSKRNVVSGESETDRRPRRLLVELSIHCFQCWKRSGNPSRPFASSDNNVPQSFRTKEPSPILANVRIPLAFGIVILTRTPIASNGMIHFVFLLCLQRQIKTAPSSMI